MAKRTLPIILLLGLLILTSCGSFKEKQQLIRLAQSGKRLAVACESYWTTIRAMYSAEERGLQTKQALYVWLSDERGTRDVPGQCQRISSALSSSAPDLKIVCQISRKLTAALSDTMRVLKELPTTSAEEPAINIRSATTALDTAISALETELGGSSDSAKKAAAAKLETAVSNLEIAFGDIGPTAQMAITKSLSTRRDYVAALDQRIAISQEIEAMFGEYEEFLNVDVKERAETATKPLISTLTAVNPIPQLSTELLNSLVQSLARMQLNNIKRKSALAAASELTEFSVLLATVFEWERYMVWNGALEQIPETASELLFLDYSLSGLALYTGLESSEQITVDSWQGVGPAGLYREVGILSRLGFLDARAKHELLPLELQKTGLGLSWKLGLLALDTAAFAHQEIPCLVGSITLSGSPTLKPVLKELKLRIEPTEIPEELKAKLGQSPARYPVLQSLSAREADWPISESPEEIATLFNRQFLRRNSKESEEPLRKSLQDWRTQISSAIGPSSAEQEKKVYADRAITSDKALSGLPYIQLLSLALHLELANI